MAWCEGRSDWVPLSQILSASPAPGAPPPSGEQHSDEIIPDARLADPQQDPIATATVVKEDLTQTASSELEQQKNKNMWHYQKNNQAFGPIDLGEVEALIRSNQILRSTQVWREGMAEWQMAIQTELQNIFPKDTPPPVSPPPIAYQSGDAKVSPADDVKRLENWFLIFWICMAAGIPLSIVIIGIPGVIAAVVFYCFIMHKLWSIIPANVAKTTPGKAVGLSFVPFFNFYWNFVAFHGLAQALNAETKRNSILNKEVNEGMSLTYCILICCSIIPYLGILTSIAALVIWILTIKQMKDAGIALIQKNNF